jgi:hypothetical protein
LSTFKDTVYSSFGLAAFLKLYRIEDESKCVRVKREKRHAIHRDNKTV